MQILQKIKPTLIWIKAEQGQVSSPMVIANEMGHSGRTFVHQPASEDRGKRLLGEKGSVEYSVEIPCQNQYRLWARVYYIDIDGNSWYCHIDDHEQTMLGNELQPIEEWHWIKGNTWNLEEGLHTLLLKTREDGARLDQLLITSLPDYVIDTIGLSIGKPQPFHAAVLMQNTLCFPTDSISFLVHPHDKYSLLESDLSVIVMVKDQSGSVVVESGGSIDCEYQLEMVDEKKGPYSIEAAILDHQNNPLETVQKDFWVIPTIQELQKTHDKNKAFFNLLPTIEEWLHEIKSGMIVGDAKVDESSRKIYEAVQSLTYGTDPFENRTGWLTKAYISTIDDTRQPYLLHIPRSYDSKKLYPLIIYMHGVTRGARHFRYMLEELAGVNADSIEDAILLSLEGRGTLWYDHIAEEDMLSVIRAVKEAYPIDEERIYLWGQSMGGYGSYRIACKYPHMWAAIAPCAGGSIPSLLGNLKHIPVNIFHGEKDVIIPVEEAYEAFNTLQSLDQEVYLSVIPGGDHQTDEVVTQNSKFWKWFLKYKKKQNPRHVVYNTYSLRHNRAYWVTIDGFIDYQLESPASIEAKIKDDNTVEIATKNIAKFTLFLNEHLIDLQRPVRCIVNGKKEFRDTEKDGRIQVVIYDYPETGLFKKHGLSGPFGDQNYDRFLILYGAKKDVAKNREAALSYAKWKSWESVCDMSHVVRSEKEISENDIRQAHLVIFGSPQNSELLAKIAKKLPVQLDDKNILIKSRAFEGETVAIRLIYPNPVNPEKYLVIFGALTPQAYQSLPEWRPNDRKFENQPEITIYDGGDQPIFNAFFDMNWKLIE